jgi:transglutaminase-like putative cysteine protease
VNRLWDPTVTVTLAGTVLMLGAVACAVAPAELSPPPARSPATQSVPGLLAPSVVQITPQWSADNSLELTIRRDPLIDDDFYWRVATYDRILPTNWEQTDTRTVAVAAGSPIGGGTADDPGAGPGPRTFTFTVIPAAYTDSRMVSPATPVLAGEDVRLTVIGDAGFFGSIDRGAQGITSEYELTALTAVRGDGAGELNAAALRATGTDYPPEVAARYLVVEPGLIGPNARALRDRIRNEAASDAPIDIARRAEELLRSKEFTYATDLRNLDCAGISTVECYATFKEGYCVQAATTMAVILRDLGVPTRLAVGFLPGSRTAGIEQIRASSAHSWVEVYFPGYGWVRFDPDSSAFPGQASTMP